MFFSPTKIKKPPILCVVVSFLGAFPQRLDGDVLLLSYFYAFGWLLQPCLASMKHRAAFQLSRCRSVIQVHSNDSTVSAPT
ncbi:hypothetical protein VIGAN_03051200 [Vigna angularis var. angularis]|uniref:Uncharacterized protein n=1 Tax=Vigna angularis var. angularis TaxID=157739 RepID=A0A0S3RK46_PHAAN|nr:hypothetical protein VIGAN_03051200 [Vigna angularis var. angularis]